MYCICRRVNKTVYEVNYARNRKMIDESLLLRYFEKEVSEEEKKKVEEWIHSSEANSRMAKQVAQIFVATLSVAWLEGGIPISRRYKIFGAR